MQVEDIKSVENNVSLQDFEDHKVSKVSKTISEEPVELME